MKTMYQIVDEPKPKALSYLIVPPIVILLVAFFLNPYWAVLWLIVNSVLLGSRTLWKEVGILALGSALAYGYLVGLGSLLGAGYFAGVEEAPRYFTIIYRGICYFFLYWAIFVQSQSYAIFKYWQTQQD